MGQVTMFQCDHCKLTHENEELFLKCQEFHRTQKELEEIRKSLEIVQKQFDIAQKKVQDSCPKHDYQETGASEPSYTMSDTRYTSYKKRCSRCGHEYWS